MSDKAAIKAAVLRDIARGMHQRVAAAKHQVPPGTVAWWVSESKRPKAEVKAAEPEKLEKAEKPEEAPKPTDTAATRARIRRAEALAERLGGRLRGDLRSTIEALTTWLAMETARSVLPMPPLPEDADEKTVAAVRKAWAASRPDMRQIQAASKALDSLLARAADLLTFDERTSDEAAIAAVGAAGPTGGESDVERLRAALRVLGPSDDEEPTEGEVSVSSG